LINQDLITHALAWFIFCYPKELYLQSETPIIFFTGAGLSALMTRYKMVQSKFQHKNILLLDENSKTNDRTWCFGLRKHQFGSPFQKMGHLFANENFKRDLHLQPYTYNRV
jgi:lycopene beta-cyclase